MTWTLLHQDVDIDGDGVVDQVKITGSNVIELLERTVEGDAPDQLPDSPPLQLPLDFSGVLDLAAAQNINGASGDDSGDVVAP